MSTITAILEPDPDGTVHLPIPPELRGGKVQVTATVAPAPNGDLPAALDTLRGFGCLRGKITLAPDFDAPLEDFEDYME